MRPSRPRGLDLLDGLGGGIAGSDSSCASEELHACRRCRVCVAARRNPEQALKRVPMRLRVPITYVSSRKCLSIKKRGRSLTKLRPALNEISTLRDAPGTGYQLILISVSGQRCRRNRGREVDRGPCHYHHRPCRAPCKRKLLIGLQRMIGRGNTNVSRRRPPSRNLTVTPG